MNSLPDKPLILIDGSSYLFRAYHALPPLTTTRGQATGAIKGVINMVRSLIKEYPDSPIAVVLMPRARPSVVIFIKNISSSSSYA